MDKDFYTALQTEVFNKFGHDCLYYVTRENKSDFLNNYQLNDIVEVKEIKILIKDDEDSAIKKENLSNNALVEIKKDDLVPKVGDLLYIYKMMYYVSSIPEIESEEELIYLINIQRYEQKTSIRVNAIQNSGFGGTVGASGTSGTSGSAGNAGVPGPGFKPSSSNSSYQLVGDSFVPVYGSVSIVSGCTSDTYFCPTGGSGTSGTACLLLSGPPTLNLYDRLNLGEVQYFSSAAIEGDLIRLAGSKVQLDGRAYPDGYYIFDGYDWIPMVTWDSSGPIKKSKKTKVYFSLDEELNDNFDKYCEENAISKSKLVENYIRKYLEDKKISGISR